MSGSDSFRIAPANKMAREQKILNIVSMTVLMIVPF